MKEGQFHIYDDDSKIFITQYRYGIYNKNICTDPILAVGTANEYCNILNEIVVKYNNLIDENKQLKQLINIADQLIEWNTVPQCRRYWEHQKRIFK